MASPHSTDQQPFIPWAKGPKSSYEPEPHHNSKKPWYLRPWVWILGIIALLALVIGGIMLFNRNDDAAPAAQQSASASPTSSPSASSTVSASESAEPSPTEEVPATGSSENAAETPDASASADSATNMQGALDQARNYATANGMSKQEIINQLIADGFSADTAKYAADNLQVDWNAIALQRSGSEANVTSPSALYQQLVAEGFTADQTQYAIDNFQGGWNEQALAAGRALREQGIDPDEAQATLTSPAGGGFTAEQAEYAVANAYSVGL